MFNVFVFLIIHVILLEALGDKGDLEEKYPIDGRITGGHDADIKDYPYTLMLIKNGDLICGAGLIAEKWALTTAACVFGRAPIDFVIRANSSVIDDGEKIAVARIIGHPNYSIYTADSDIALLELSNPVNCSNCKIISLGTTAPTKGLNVTITGWGSTGANNIHANTLQVAQIPVIDHDICKETYAKARKVTENMFCAGYGTIGGTDWNYGDTGGPTVINGALVGLAAWGYGSVLKGYPSVYTLVPNFVDWIRNNTGIDK